LRTQLKEIQTIGDVQELDSIKEENRRIAKEHEKEKNQLMSKINNLQKQLISSSPEVSKSYIEEREKREQKLTFMEQNYKNLEEEVKQMRGLLSELRRKYKNASKEIFQLEIEHEK
jgi:chromosome segregation ATPase